MGRGGEAGWAHYRQLFLLVPAHWNLSRDAFDATLHLQEERGTAGTANPKPLCLAHAVVVFSGGGGGG